MNANNGAEWHMPIEAPKPLEEWNDAQPGDVLAICEDYEQIIQTLRARAHLAGLAYAEVDDRSGMPDNYFAKVVARIKGLGPLSLPNYLGALKLKLVIVSDGPLVPTRPRHAEQDRHPWQPDGALLRATGAI